MPDTDTMTTADTKPRTCTLPDADSARSQITQIIERGEVRHYQSRYAITDRAIGALTDVLGDANPIYTDDVAARAAGHPGIVAPATSLQVWAMNRLDEQLPPSPVDRAYQILQANGFTSVVAVNGDQTYDRYLRPEDRLHSEERVESISELKHTGLGEGLFITTLITFLDEADEQVGTMRFRTLWYAPRTQPDTITEA
ncbi:MAG: MaoC family dehydratase N-terminal domain-containing protein [Intrasporangium sp.]|uniref:FAS1-like dehydratase domain-containing protein n=1 Tax=Intrasporangium sp. TaxID=1925024 RepID=UPI0026486EC4|nr:MaoC family dehydratase N-terminal domain-containing protein [Intrasporangium sp.]MDN5796922.1 MaoC family dehydratase N-terminal domain-containing protein [Intrasporangium sp.]